MSKELESLIASYPNYLESREVWDKRRKELTELMEKDDLYVMEN